MLLQVEVRDIVGKPSAAGSAQAAGELKAWFLKMGSRWPPLPPHQEHLLYSDAHSW